MIQLSVVIITLNEEKNIARCLDSVKEIADDIVVVDSFSADKTEEICKKYNVNFIQRKWEGYATTKNFANEQAKFDRILSLDADEALSEELKKSISDWKKLSSPVPAKFSRLANYCGQWIRHCGWYPDIKVRIFDRKQAKWSGAIHETLSGINEKNVLLLRGDCFHYSYNTIEEHYKQAEKYAGLSAKTMYSNGESVFLPLIYIKSFFKFIRNYFVKLGILDGRYGYVICKITAWETYMKYSKLYKLNQNA